MSEMSETGETTEVKPTGGLSVGGSPPPLPELTGLTGRRGDGTGAGAGVAPLRVAASCASGVLLMAAAQAASLPGLTPLPHRLLLVALLSGALASGGAGLAARTPEGARAAWWALAAALGAAWVVWTS